MTSLYFNAPDGLCGNDDCGQMSAWYVLSALGFYPVNPTSCVYVIGSPLVSKATIHLDPRFHKGRTFTIIAEDNSPQNMYVQSATLNGKPLMRSWFSHAELAAGGELVLKMGRKPKPPGPARPKTARRWSRRRAGLWSAVIYYRFLLPRSGFSLAVIYSALDFAAFSSDQRSHAGKEKRAAPRQMESGNKLPHSKEIWQAGSTNNRTERLSKKGLQP